MTSKSGIQSVGGSFRDPVNRVYESGDRVLRGIGQSVHQEMETLLETKFFRKLSDQGKIVRTKFVSDKTADEVRSDGWAGVLEHERVPFISYPYEWPFSMLRDAALLQLELIEVAITNGWALKDATAYNIQWMGARPIFIDVASFEPRPDGEPWLGYRQFCSHFLIPLMLRAHLGIDYLPMLRSQLDGIPAIEAAKLFRGLSRAKSGVLAHVILPSKIENRISASERDRAPARRRQANHSLPMVLGLVQSMQRLVRKLKSPVTHTDWSQYDKTHSYEEPDFNAKVAFVQRNAGRLHHRFVWDIGCNTGVFSRLCENFADNVVSIDGDHNAVEQLYISEKSRDSRKILPLVMNLANISPAQGWAGMERASLDGRVKPDLVLSLALIHHIRLSANIPMVMFFDWLHSLECNLIIEFVDREDEMVRKLLTNKKERYEDYNFENFMKLVKERYTVVDREKLKTGHREIFYLERK